MFRFFILSKLVFRFPRPGKPQPFNFPFSVFNFQFIRTFAAVKNIAQLCLLSALLLLSACTPKPKVEAPAELIGEDTIVQMIAEQMVIESTIFNAPPTYDKDGLTQAFYSQFFEKYNVSVPRYKSSLTYYFADKERMNDILTRAKERVDAQNAALPNQ